MVGLVRRISLVLFLANALSPVIPLLAQTTDGSITVSTIVRRALIDAGIDSVGKRAHLLRHTLATDLLPQEVSLDEIGELLRHQSPNTTGLYAKVDLTALRTLALPWPGGMR